MIRSADAIYFSVVTSLTIGFGGKHHLYSSKMMLIQACRLCSNQSINTVSLQQPHARAVINSYRILDFPFAVLSIALLAVMIGQIVNFFCERAAHRKESYRARFEKEFEKRRNESGDLASRTLVMEIAELQEM